MAGVLRTAGALRMKRRSLMALLACALFAACGVGTYRTARVTGELEVRLVARSQSEGEEVARWFTGEVLRLEPRAFVDASHVREVHLEERPDGARHIVLYLDAVGTERLAEVTGAHRGRRLAIVVDGRVVVAPTIRTAITEGEAHLTVGPEGDIEQVFDALTRARD